MNLSLNDRMQLVVTRLDVPSYVLIDINLFKDLAFVFVDHFLLLFAVDVFYLIYLSLWLKKKKNNFFLSLLFTVFMKTSHQPGNRPLQNPI